MDLISAKSSFCARNATSPTETSTWTASLAHLRARLDKDLLLDVVGLLVLRFVIGAHDQVRHEARGDQLDTGEGQQHADEQQGPAADAAHHDLFHQQVEVDQHADHEQRQSAAAKQMHRPLPILLEEQHQHQVAGDLEGAAQAVFRHARMTRVVPYFHLGHPGAIHAGQHRNVTVQFAIQAEALGDVAAEQFQRAAIVLHVHASAAPYQPVGNLAGHLAQQEAVLAPGADARHYVPVAFLHASDHQRDVARVVLHVAVEHHDQFAFCGIDAGGHRRGLAIVAVQYQHPGAWRTVFLDFGDGAVARAVIHEDHFVFDAGERLGNAAGQQRNIAFLVHDRDDD